MQAIFHQFPMLAHLHFLWKVGTTIEPLPPSGKLPIVTCHPPGFLENQRIVPLYTPNLWGPQSHQILGNQASRVWVSPTHSLICTNHVSPPSFLMILLLSHAWIVGFGIDSTSLPSSLPYVWQVVSPLTSRNLTPFPYVQAFGPPYRNVALIPNCFGLVFGSVFGNVFGVDERVRWLDQSS